ncbi:MAG: bifunctional pyr operon transcriptional regulator/uracil phosphoribosyltransferase PyrR [Gammaproteobacteria bacterium]
MTATKTTSAEIEKILKAMASDLQAFLKKRGRKKVAIIGIHTGGVKIAQRLHELLKIKEPLGELNIAFYRDDFSRIGMHPSVEPSNLAFDVDDRHIVLVDDILYTGRTIRAALNEIFDYGRPSSVTLAVLVDRTEQELPFKADVVGTTMSLSDGEHVKLAGSKKLTLVTK